MTGSGVISKVNEHQTLYPILNNILHQQDQPRLHLYSNKKEYQSKIIFTTTELRLACWLANFYYQ